MMIIIAFSLSKRRQPVAIFKVVLNLCFARYWLAIQSSKKVLKPVLRDED